MSQDENVIRCSISDTFAQWMSQAGGSLLATTYQAGKVVLVGWDGRQVTLLMRDFPKPLGVAINGSDIALATRDDVIFFNNAPLLAHDYLETQKGKYDAIYLPRASYHTGDLNVHDLGFGEEGLWLVNTRFSCLSMLSRSFSFIPKWKPPFVSEIVPEDRCHMNGLAMIDGKPRFVTCHGDSNLVGGWREGKAGGGVLVDVQKNEVIVRGLSMPHSPRWYKGQLWLLNSGAGEIWVVNPATGQHQVVCALPGYLRGLGFVGPYALVGMSQIREKHIFGDLPVQTRHSQLLCGIAIVDLRSGQSVGMIEFTAGCQELYEVQFLAGVSRPTILNLQSEGVRQAFPAPDFSYWLRPSSQIPDA